MANNILQNLVNMSYDEILQYAKHATSDLIAAADRFFANSDNKEDFRTIFIMQLVSQCIAADGIFSALEKKLMADLLGVEPNVIENFISDPFYCSADALKLADQVVDSLSSEEKAAALLFVSAIAAVDEKITREELAYIGILAE